MDIISFEDLVQIFKRVALKAGFNERWFYSLVESHGLPFMAPYIISQLWLKQITEDEDIQEFRKQILFLNVNGFFNVLKQ